MTAALLAGAFFGLGGYLLFRALFPPRPGLSARLAAFDAARRLGEAQPSRTASTAKKVTGLRAQVGRSLAAFYEARGWQQRSVRADLALLDRSFEGFLATKFLLSAAAPPEHLDVAMPDLRTRLAACVVVGLVPLDDAERAALLKDRAQARGLLMPDEVARWLLNTQARGSGALIDALDALDRASLSEKRRLTLPFVQSVLRQPAP